MGGKKKGQKGLGQSIIKDRFQSRPHKTSSFLHTSELHDGYDWGRLNLQSVTEQSNLDDFLATAELADTQFTAEKLNVRIVNASRECVIMNPESRLKQSEAQQENKDLLKIPRRPTWNEHTTPDELDRLERDAFLDWRRQLNELQEKEHIMLTPFEKNLEFWRQLWRVIERSDIVVQIVDARNPLLFRCEDLEKYVKEAGENKINLILVNKADHLTERQRKYWYDYFSGLNVNVVFWSAVLEADRLKAQEKAISEEEGEEIEIVDESSSLDDESDDDVDDVSGDGMYNKTESESVPSWESVPSTEVSERLGQASLAAHTLKESAAADEDNSAWRVLNGEDLVDIWKRLHKAEKVTEGVTTIGLVGYPNVGKSSTINAILKTKKVPVSATPGRTKHFQTLYLEEDLVLCDCPGLVMPSFVSTKADMVVSGILPIDQMRDYIPPVTLVCELIPRDILESSYGMNIAEPIEGQDPQRPPTAHELLTAYGLMRGYMTHKGVPDLPRSSRIILKDFVNGKLLYRYPPPGVTADDYQPTSYPEMRKTKPSKDHGNKNLTGGPVRSIDKAFFAKGQQQVHAKGVIGVRGPLSAPSNTTSQDGLNTKPWKRHGNRGKKEKLRRTFAHLDQHWN